MEDRAQIETMPDPASAAPPAEPVPAVIPPPRFGYTRSPMKLLLYRCQTPKCGAQDRLKIFAHEAVPLVVNCWKCHAGMKLSPDNMLAQNKGMKLVAEAEIDPITGDLHEVGGGSIQNQSGSGSSPISSPALAFPAKKEGNA